MPIIAVKISLNVNYLEGDSKGGQFNLIINKFGLS